MTIVTTTTSSGPYVAVAQTTFAVAFYTAGASEIEVTLDAAIVDPSLYVFTRDTDGTGQVVFTTPVSGTVYIYGKPSMLQQTHFSRFGAFFPDQINGPLDRLSAGNLFLSSALIPAGSTRTSRAGYYLAWDASGNPVLTDAQGPAGPSGNGTAAVSSRASLAAVTGAINGESRLLAESGREGTFAFNTADLSAMVSKDPLQAVYVAPAAAPTGASGAWVRRFSGPVDTAWFGTVADCTAYNTGTDNSPAFQAAINFMYATGGWLHTGDGKYRLSTRLLNKSAFKWTGTSLLQDSTGASNPGASRGSTLVTDTNVNALRNSFTVDGDVSAAATNPGAGGMIIEGIRFLSSNNKTVSAGNYGVENRARVTMRNCIVRGFGDHGIYTRASLTGSDGVVYGNANGSVYDTVDAIRNAGHGFATSGNDANNITFSTCTGQDNGDHDFNDDGFINNTYLNCLSEGGDLGSFRTIRAAAVHSFIGCNDEGGTNTIGASCFVRGGTVGQKANGQTHEMHGRMLAYDGATIRNGTTLSFNNTGDGTTLDVSNDGTNILVGAPLKTLGSIQCRNGTIGYLLGNGGAVVQATSKATGVTLNTSSGQITLNNAALAAGAKVSFVVTNSTVVATDTVIPSVASGGTANAYRAAVTAVANGSFTLTVENITGGSLSEAPVVNFAVIKGAAS